MIIKRIIAVITPLKKRMILLGHRAILFLFIILLILFSGCEIIDIGFLQEIDLFQFNPGSILFRGTVNGIQFTGVKISSTLIEVNMINLEGSIATVNSTLSVLFGSGMLNNAITRNTTVFPNGTAKERYGIQPNAIFRFRVNYIRR